MKPPIQIEGYGTTYVRADLAVPIYPQPIAVDRCYFDAPAMIEELERRVPGGGYGSQSVAVGLSKSHLQALTNGKRWSHAYLETYLRVLATLGLPVGAFLDTDKCRNAPFPMVLED